MDLTQHMQSNEYLYVQPLHQPVRDSDDFDDDDDEQDLQHGSKTTVGAAVFSYLCTCVGAGVLSLPGALKYCGWTGLILMAFVAVLSNHTAKYLCACLFARPGMKLRTYEDIGEQAFGHLGRRVVGFFQIITLFGVCTIFLILIGQQLLLLPRRIHTLLCFSVTHRIVCIFAVVL
jgi:amino acid permease